MSHIIICGDRNWKNYESILNFVKTLDKNIIVIQGGCSGADLLAKKASQECGLVCVTMNANWKKYGKVNGPLRNEQMLEISPEFVVAFHSNIEDSKGTKNMIELAKSASIPVMIIKE